MALFFISFSGIILSIAILSHVNHSYYITSVPLLQYVAWKFFKSYCSYFEGVKLLKRCCFVIGLLFASVPAPRAGLSIFPIQGLLFLLGELGDKNLAKEP